MNEREALREAIKNYCFKYWDTYDEEHIERLLAGTMSLIAVEMWGKPFTQFAHPVILEEEKSEEEKHEN